MILRKTGPAQPSPSQGPEPVPPPSDEVVSLHSDSDQNNNDDDDDKNNENDSDDDNGWPCGFMAAFNLSLSRDTTPEDADNGSSSSSSSRRMRETILSRQRIVGRWEGPATSLRAPTYLPRRRFGVTCVNALGSVLVFGGGRIFESEVYINYEEPDPISVWQTNPILFAIHARRLAQGFAHRL